MLIRRRSAIVAQILFEDHDITEVLIEIEGTLQKAINYNGITGKISIGDHVVVNTNGVYLNLGSGGYHFVISNLSHPNSDFLTDEGHIIKLRYTPMQIKCSTVEEPGSPYHDLLKNMDSVDHMKVIIGSLHSMLSPVVHVIKHYRPSARIVYIMSDSACLPIMYSNTVRQLKKSRLIDCTITSGQAFGGDYETVNVYTALLTAKYVCNCDIAVVIPGPGVVGTGTKLGFSNIEEGHLIDAVNNLKGIPFVIPRISFSDPRERHIGISHHSLTVLSKICHSRAYIGFPVLNTSQNQRIQNQIRQYGIDKKHTLRFLKESTIEILKQRNVSVTTMGRGISEDLCYFKAIGSTVAFCLKVFDE